MSAIPKPLFHAAIDYRRERAGPIIEVIEFDELRRDLWQRLSRIRRLNVASVSLA